MATITDAIGVTLKPYYVALQTPADMSDYDYMGSLIGDKLNSAVFDNLKVKGSVPEFVCIVSAKEGVRRTVEYVLAHPRVPAGRPRVRCVVRQGHRGDGEDEGGFQWLM